MKVTSHMASAWYFAMCWLEFVKLNTLPPFLTEDTKSMNRQSGCPSVVLQLGPSYPLTIVLWF